MMTPSDKARKLAEKMLSHITLGGTGRYESDIAEVLPYATALLAAEEALDAITRMSSTTKLRRRANDALASVREALR